MSSRTRRVQGTVWASTVDPADQVTLDPGMPADLDRLLMAAAAGQALASCITTSRQPQEVASFGLSRFNQPR